MGYKNQYNKNTQTSTVLLIVLIIYFSSVMDVVSCKPSTKNKNSHPRPAAVQISSESGEDSSIEARVKPCHEDEDLMELCQRCAKVTKSKIVFPMCCSNEDEVTNWCRNYVYYGMATKK